MRLKIFKINPPRTMLSRKLFGSFHFLFTARMGTRIACPDFSGTRIERIRRILYLRSKYIARSLLSFFIVCETNKIRIIRSIRVPEKSGQAIRVPILAVDPQAKSFKNLPNTYVVPTNRNTVKNGSFLDGFLENIFRLYNNIEKVKLVNKK